MENWDDRRFFLALARSSSVRKAAKKLGTSRSTVLRRITALEDELGVRLFERLPNGYYTTSAGEEMQLATERMEAEALAADRRLAGLDTRLSGTIRVTISGVFASYVLMKDLAAFAKTHPAIRLEIFTGFDMFDLAKRESDVAIRISNDPPDDLVGRRVLKMARAAYVSADHLPNSGHTGPPDHLSWIGQGSDSSSQQWLGQSDYPELPITTIITDPNATVCAIRAGLGMSILPCFIGDSEPGIYRMPPDNLRYETDVWVLTHADLRNTARIRLFTEFMGKALTRHRDLLEGKCPRELPTNHS